MKILCLACLLLMSQMGWANQATVEELSLETVARVRLRSGIKDLFADSQFVVQQQSLEHRYELHQHDLFTFVIAESYLSGALMLSNGYECAVQSDVWQAQVVSAEKFCAVEILCHRGIDTHHKGA